MSRREMDRAQVVGKVVEGRLTQANAAKMLKLSVRQVKRLCVKFRDVGPPGLAHRLRGRPSNRQIDPWRLETALNALHDPLWDGFGPTFTHDKLKELCGVTLGVETLRQLMIQADLWRPWGQRLKHRSWRERRECVGMLVQLDGSDHDWFEGRGPRCVLIIYIDDATSRILHGEFVGVEDTMTLLHTTRSYLKAHGRPRAFYVDHDSIYVNNAPGDEQPMTQFARAMSELDVDIIAADSPQAKGRVERGFHTHQDRLVKELRLRGISTPEAANRYLQGGYIPKHNARYAVSPRSTLDAHRPLIAGLDLLGVLSVKLKRVVRNDYTIQYFKRWIQLTAGAGVRPKAEV
ncbi:MAG: ISNCY family transposase, partial [Pseudomonadota bacterium]